MACAHAQTLTHTTSHIHIQLLTWCPNYKLRAQRTNKFRQEESDLRMSDKFNYWKFSEVVVIE